jgi:hypothetical protein
MSIPGISSTQSLSASALVAPRHTHYKKDPSGQIAAPEASTGSSADSGNQLAAAVAAALSQLGFGATAGAAPAATGMAATGSASLAPLQQEPKAAKQVQQYTNVASTFSNLAQVLNASSGTAAQASSGSGGLTSVFQNLWASLGAPSETSSDASSGTLPSLPSFVQTLARNFSESSISGLRGVFVDTVV